MSQRVLTPTEYAALGYVQREDFDPTMFQGKGDEPLPDFWFDFPAYRADSKREYYVDLGIGLFKITTTLTSGGIIPAGRVALGYTLSLLK